MTVVCYTLNRAIGAAVQDGCKIAQMQLRFAPTNVHLVTEMKRDPEAIAIIAAPDEFLLVELINGLREARTNNLLYVIFDFDADHKIVAAVLNAGADQTDYWPTDRRVIAAQLVALSNRTSKFVEPVYRIGDDIDFFPSKHLLRRGDAEVHLTGMWTTLLEILCQSPNRVVTKATIHEALYKGAPDAPDYKIIDVSICNLRKRMASISPLDFIESEWGAGYIFRPAGFECARATRRIGAMRKPAR